MQKDHSDLPVFGKAIRHNERIDSDANDARSSPNETIVANSSSLPMQTCETRIGRFAELSCSSLYAVVYSEGSRRGGADSGPQSLAEQLES